MKSKKFVLLVVVAISAVSCQMELSPPVSDAGGKGLTSTIGIDVLLSTAPSDSLLRTLGKYGKVRDVLVEISAVTMQVPASALPTIRALPFVLAANPDQERTGGPVGATAATDASAGLSTWDLDAVNVTDFGGTREVSGDGSGVYVAVLDTGLVNDWPAYFPAGRIATQYAACFGGGGGEAGTVSSQPNKWGTDTNSHGTHVTSTILGYSMRGAEVNGVAPLATVIPVKVLNQNGSGWSSVVARGILYVAHLKTGPLAGSPVVINMSLGGPSFDAVEKRAIDFAIGRGVIVVASAGNEGAAGMGFPGAYPPVISVAASGWIGEWVGGSAWWLADVPERSPSSFYIADFSSRALPGQDLDVAAPGSWVVGPYQTNSGQASYYFLGGTSMASPHVAGIVALMAQKRPGLTAAEAEAILVGSAVPLAAGTRTIFNPDGSSATVSWGSDATGAGLADAAAALKATR